MSESCEHPSFRHPNPMPYYGDACADCGTTYQGHNPGISEERYEELRCKGEFWGLVIAAVCGEITLHKGVTEIERLLVTHGEVE